MITLRKIVCLTLSVAFVCVAALPTRATGEVVSIPAPLPPKYASPTPEFFIAAVKGDIAQLQKSLNEGISPDANVPQPAPAEVLTLFSPRSHGGLILKEPGATALMLAVAAGNDATMDFLISAKADTEARTRSGTRPLDLAAERNDIPAMQRLLGVTPDSDAKRLSILVDLAAQRAILSRDGVPVLTTKISSGKKEKPTPPGTYVITQKYSVWRSTLYHNAPMPYFLRLSCGTVGLHQGVLPGYPASHGCVRLPEAVAKKLFETVPRGTVVEIRNGDPASPVAPAVSATAAATSSAVTATATAKR